MNIQDFISDAPTRWRNGNVLAIGSSGSGKTTTFALPTILSSSDSSFIVSDVKNFLYNATSETLRANGYRVILYDFANPQNPRASRYNVFQGMHRKPDGSVEQSEVQKITSLLIPRDLDKSEPFWVLTAGLILSTMTNYMLENFRFEDWNMNTLSEIWGTFNRQIKNSSNFLDEDTVLHPESNYAKQYAMWGAYAQPDSKCWGSLAFFVAQAINIFMSCPEKLCNTVDKDDIPNFQQKAAIFINQADSDRAFDPVISILFSQLFNQAYQLADASPSQTLQIPIHFILDDAGSSLAIPDLDKLFNTCRSRNIKISLCLQSLSQLEMYGKHQAISITDSADTIFYYGTNSIPTIDFISKKTDRLHRTIATLPLDQMIIYRRGMEPLFITKPDPQCFKKLLTPRKENTHDEKSL